MKLLYALFLSLSLIGCAHTSVMVPIDTSSLGEDEATVIVYTQANETWDLYLNGESLGALVATSPIKVAVEPGPYKIWVQSAIMLDRVTEVFLDAGKTYYFKATWKGTIVPGLIVSRVERTFAIDNYETYR